MRAAYRASRGHRGRARRLAAMVWALTLAAAGAARQAWRTRRGRDVQAVADSIRPTTPAGACQAGDRTAEDVRAFPPGGTHPTTEGGTSMRFAELAAEMRAAASSYAPEDMMQVARDLARLPEALADVAHAVRVITIRAANELPVHPAVTELLAGVYDGLMKAAVASAEVAPTMRRVHEADIARHEAPRPGERLWNVP